MMFVLYTMEEAETKIQNRINEIIKNIDHANFDKLPGLIEALKIIMENKE
jgi:Txe/YoeB family toxin of Txe-Axe toxin-antitoxin module